MPDEDRPTTINVADIPTVAALADRTIRISLEQARVDIVMGRQVFVGLLYAGFRSLDGEDDLVITGSPN
jgi:hypothetical protein